MIPPLYADSLTALIGQTPLLRIPSLSHLTGCDILLKCEFMNPGGSIKDRAALQMVEDALETGVLKPGMTIVEGTAGNTGIGLAIVAKAAGCKMKVVMPRGQTPEKERLIALHGAELHLVDPVPFANPAHFYHTARQLAEDSKGQMWWANQFENLSNFKAHFTRTGPEIWQQTQGKLDALVSAAGTGGTIGGTSAYLKTQNPDIQVVLADPEGSGLYSYLQSGEFKSSGSSMTEGIGIMRLVANFAQARVDSALQVTDRELVTLAHYLRNQDALVVGSSTALNLVAAVRTALRLGKGKRIVTFACDLGERSYSKLYTREYLLSREINPDKLELGALLQAWRLT